MTDELASKKGNRSEVFFVAENVVTIRQHLIELVATFKQLVEIIFIYVEAVIEPVKDSTNQISR